MFIAGDEVLLRAVEADSFEVVMRLLRERPGLGPMSRLLAAGSPAAPEQLLALTGSRELAAGRLMAVGRPGKPDGAGGLLLIEQADWKNGQLQISVYPEPGCETDVADGLKALMRFGFEEMRMAAAVVCCPDDDRVAGQICRLAGMTRDACLKGRLFRDGRSRDVAVYTLIREADKEVGTDEKRGPRAI